MTDVTTETTGAEPELSAADEQLLRELTERARAGGLKLTGEGGLLGKLTKMVVEGALEGEMDDHLGYSRHAPEGRKTGNSRNGHRAKTVLTEAGPVEISVPRDRDSSFEPKIVAKRQRRLTGVEEMVISLSAKGLTHGEISSHLQEIYGAEVSKQTITAITDRVMDGMAEWQSRPLDPVYAVVFIDAIQVKIPRARSPAGRSTWPWASPPRAPGTSWACGRASTATARAPSSGSASCRRSRTAAPATCSWWSATG
jgi:putative transposase